MRDARIGFDLSTLTRSASLLTHFAKGCTPMTNETTPAAALTYESSRWIATPAAELGALALRFLGVKIALDALGQMPLALTLFSSESRGGAPTWVAFAIYIAWNVGIAVVLLAFARPIAGVVFGRRNATIADLGPASWMTLVVAGAGVTFAIFSVGDVVTMIGRHGLPNPTLPWSRSIDVLLAAVKVGVGLLFFFAPSLLVGPWLRRIAPLDDHDDALTGRPAP